MNNEWFIKFEEYLQGEMNSEEKAAFEAELSSNEEMNSALMVYRTIEREMGIHQQNSGNERDLKRSLETLNAKYFEGSKQTTKVISIFSSRLFKTAISIAASLIIVLVVYAIFFQPKQDIKLLADTYINTHLTQLSQTMDATPDSIQLGISAFNQKDYNQALKLFEGVQENQPENVEALKNIGIVYLVNKDFEKALEKFDELASMENLYSNPGIFYKAVTLMHRDEKGDKQEAKRLLEQVVEEDAVGSEQAKEWLRNF